MWLVAWAVSIAVMVVMVVLFFTHMCMIICSRRVVTCIDRVVDCRPRVISCGHRVIFYTHVSSLNRMPADNNTMLCYFVRILAQGPLPGANKMFHIPGDGLDCP